MKIEQPMGEVNTVNVLDHGFARLVDYMGSDLSVVRAARVSYDAAWRAGDDQGSDARLIKYLWRHKHSTPFEAATLTFEIKAPIFVFRQWHRHRTWSYNEMSARYTELLSEYYLPDPQIVGVQDPKNKQGRTTFQEDRALNTKKRQSEINEASEIMQECFITYRNLLAEGWPRELARSVLPVATYSHMFATVNLLNFFKFCTLRDDPHAQYEIRVYAQAMMLLVRQHFPVCVEAWEGDHGTQAETKT